MDIRIGILHVQRELTLETDLSAQEVQQRVAEAVKTGEALQLTDTKGRELLIVPQNLAYVEIGTESGRKVGFVS
ncbi:MAG: DUF3107 domain-containing protein [Microbacteriaceae bacterium]|nr:DUF3107 domain-containing protein [Microbacteriaceae bacterium]